MAEKRKKIKGRGRDVGIPPVREDLTTGSGDTAADACRLKKRGADRLGVERPRAHLVFIFASVGWKDVGMKLWSRRMAAGRERDQ